MEGIALLYDIVLRTIFFADKFKQTMKWDQETFYHTQMFLNSIVQQ